MFTATRIESTIKPEKFESLNNGIWYYNYDVREYTTLVRDMETDEDSEETRYSFILVRINGKPTLQKCLEAILKQFVDEHSTSLYNTFLAEGYLNQLVEDIYYNIKVDFGLEEGISPLELAKKNVIRLIDAYDTSSEVNSFFLNGIQVWLDKDTRVGLMNSIKIEKDAGKELSVLWFNNICITVNCDQAIQMLSALELYALECYNKTAEHRVMVLQLSDILSVLEYDYTTGYPEKLQLTI